MSRESLGAVPLAMRCVAGIRPDRIPDVAAPLGHRAWVRARTFTSEMDERRWRAEKSAWKWNIQLLCWLGVSAITAYILREALSPLGVRDPLQHFVVASLIASLVSLAVIFISLRIIRKQNPSAQVKEEND